MADFERAYARLAAPSAGYADGRAGRTGESYCRISRRFHPQWSGWRRIDAARIRAGFPDSLDRDRYLPGMVERFHKRNYWDRLAGDQLAHQGLAEELYRCAIDQGPRRTVRILQQSLNMLGAARHDRTFLKVDGLPGDGTLRAVRAYVRKEPAAESLLQVIELLRSGADVLVARRARQRSLPARG